MCTEDVYTDIYADGRRVEHVRPNFCSRSRYGQLCDSPVVYKHPSRIMQAGDQPAKFLYPTMLPPTPRQTPRSTTPVYRSGDESDRSHHSSGSASGRRRASAVYVNGQKVLDLGGSGHRKRDSRTERIVIVDSPPTQRTPPQQYTMPYTAPPSPNAGVAGPFTYNIVEPLAPHRRESTSGGLRPVIVDERPRPHVSIEVVNHDRRRQQPHRSSHRRQHSDDSRHSHHSRSSSSAESDEERRARRHRERADKERAEEEVRRQKLRARVAAANAEINRRPAVPIRSRAPAVAAPKQQQQPAYVRPAVEVAVPVDRERELVEAVRQLDISNRRLAAEKERRDRERAERDEEEAQRARLKERMQPRRRATVGPGSRRHRVLYDDGLYRWE